MIRFINKHIPKAKFKEIALTFSAMALTIIAGTLTLAVSHSILKIGLPLSLLASLPVCLIGVFITGEVSSDDATRSKKKEQDQPVEEL